MMFDMILKLDWQLFHLINSAWATPWGDVFFPLITDLHKTLFFKLFLLPLLFLVFIWRRGVKQGLVIFLFCITTVLASDGIGNYGFKKTFQRLRPPDSISVPDGIVVQARTSYGGNSFVSNHAANMFGTATFISVMFPPATIPVYSLAALVGYSRVYNGVHFPSDVIAGAFIGVLCGLLFSFICKLALGRLNPAKGKSA